MLCTSKCTGIYGSLLSKNSVLAVELSVTLSQCACNYGGALRCGVAVVLLDSAVPLFNNASGSSNKVLKERQDSKEKEPLVQLFAS